MNTTTRPMQRIELGDQVRERHTGRVGQVTQVTRDRLFVRFVEGQKSSYLDRRMVDSVKFLTALAEVDEDERNVAAYAESVR